MHASDNSSQTNSNNLEARQRNADKLGKYEKSEHPQAACRLTKSSEGEEGSPGRQNQRSQGLFIESTLQVRSVRRKVRTPPNAQILFLTQILNIFILDAFALLKLSVVQQNSPKFKNESDDTCQETSVYMSILSSTLTLLIPPPSLPRKCEQIEQKSPPIHWDLQKRQPETVIYGT